MKHTNDPIPVIDLFAGPGGLSEGFASFRPRSGPRYRLELSVECDLFAHQTLTLRALYREFTAKRKLPPRDYVLYLKGEISREKLFDSHRQQSERAESEACFARLGQPDGDEKISARLEAIRKGGVDLRRSVMIGGPPCQAYSLVGRSRLSRAKASGAYREEHDGRHTLYLEYLRLIEQIQPAVFVMENVRGILSATYQGRPIFSQILGDLASSGYDLHAVGSRAIDAGGNGDDDPRKYLLMASDFGVPQRRARVFIVGTRKSLHLKQIPSLRNVHSPSVRDVLQDLPPLRSGFSTKDDTADAWKQFVRETAAQLSKELRKHSKDVALRLEQIANSKSRLPSHRTSIASNSEQVHFNHETRGHIQGDLERYMFYAAWGEVRKSSPSLADLPSRLLPNHKNVREASLNSAVEGVAFSDRFRVQLADMPATTITSHIAKDGHYFIHFDPQQCRSLTVREAARLQTFPDNYYFCGPRTEQYRQVGNAVPPRLASRIASAIHSLDIW